MWSTFLPIILIFIVFYFMIIVPGRRRERQQREMLFNSLKKDDRVVTSSGIIGIVANINEKDDEVVLKVDESSNVRLRMLRSAIVRIMTPREGASESSTAVKAGAPPS